MKEPGGHQIAPPQHSICQLLSLLLHLPPSRDESAEALEPVVVKDRIQHIGILVVILSHHHGVRSDFTLLFSDRVLDKVFVVVFEVSVGLPDGEDLTDFIVSVVLVEAVFFVKVPRPRALRFAA